MGCFIVCLVVEYATLALSFNDLHSESEQYRLLGVRMLEIGCTAPPPSKLWRMFIPAFVLHTILYLFTAYRGIRNRSIAAEAAPLMRRLLRECVSGQWYDLPWLTCGLVVVYYILLFSVRRICIVCACFLILCPQSLWASQPLVLLWQNTRQWVRFNFAKTPA